MLLLPKPVSLCSFLLDEQVYKEKVEGSSNATSKETSSGETSTTRSHHKRVAAAALGAAFDLDRKRKRDPFSFAPDFPFFSSFFFSLFKTLIREMLLAHHEFAGLEHAGSLLPIIIICI